MWYVYKSGNYSYLIKAGLGLGEDTWACLHLLILCLLGCQSLRETLLCKVKLTQDVKTAVEYKRSIVERKIAIRHYTV